MTQEQHQSHSQASLLIEEQHIRRRSRSLSELPGHMRVPILRRQDTARTQARLEAGAAGVEELRILREKHQQIFDQTKNATQRKWKQSSQQRLAHTVSERNSLQHRQPVDHTNQQMHKCSCSLSAWYSTNHLSSISEEMDNSPNETRKKYCPESSVNATNGSKCAFEHYTNNHRVDTNLNKRIQNQCQEKIFRSVTIKTEKQASAEKHKISTDKEFSQKNTLNKHVPNYDKSNNISVICKQTRSSSVCENCIQCKDNRNHHNLSDMYHKQNTRMTSDQNYPRGRSQSFTANFTFFSDTKENNSENRMDNDLVHDVSNCQTETEDNNSNEQMDLHELESNSSSNCELNSGASCNSILKYKNLSNATKYNKQSSTYPTSSFSHPLQIFSPLSQPRSKSISWDNLLAVIGLNNDNDQIIKEQEDENNDDVFQNSPQDSEPNNENLKGSEIEDVYVVQRKKLRSQSFTYGHSFNPSDKSRILKIQHPSFSCCRKNGHFNHKNIDNKMTGTDTNECCRIMKRHSVDHQMYPSKELNPTCQLRRASIQCEAVLTQIGNPKRIINPLQDVDINSLQTPGPLHAVTLQYTCVPMRNTSSSCVKPAYNDSVILKEKSETLNNLSKMEAISSTSSHINQSGHSTDSGSEAGNLKSANCKLNAEEPYHSKLVNKNSPEKYPVARPRTSIVKVLSDQGNPATNNTIEKESNILHNRTSVISNKTSTCEENSSPKDDQLFTSQLTNVILKDHSVTVLPNPVLMQNQHSTCLINKKDTLCSNSPLENQELLTTSDNKELCPNSTLINNKSCSLQESCKKENFSLAELEKSKIDILKERERNKSKIRENLSLWMKSYPDRKTKFYSCDNIPLTDDSSKSTHKPMNVSFSTSPPSCKNNLKEDNLDNLKLKVIDRKSSSFSPEQQHIHTPDVSIISDEGYNTFDSISQHSQNLTCGQSKPCDIISSSNDSSTNAKLCNSLSCLSADCNKINYFNDLKHNKENRTKVNDSDTKIARASDCSDIDCFSEQVCDHNEKQENTVISDLSSNQNHFKSSMAVTHNCSTKYRNSHQATITTNVSSADASGAHVENDKNSNNKKIVNTTKSENNEQASVKINIVTNCLNNTEQNAVKVVHLSFKQTAV